ncbi:hypothetical protein VTK56DRAFT_5337 [Thermocarpiscus australiensis]
MTLESSSRAIPSFIPHHEEFKSKTHLTSNLLQTPHHLSTTMLFKQSAVAVLMAFASLALARPAPDVVDLSVRDEEYGVEYKRSTIETFVCKRNENQSLSCLRKKSGDDADQSKTASN